MYWYQVGKCYPQDFSPVVLYSFKGERSEIGYCEKQYRKKTKQEKIDYFGSEENYKEYLNDPEWQMNDQNYSDSIFYKMKWYKQNGKRLGWEPTHFCIISPPENMHIGDTYEVKRDVQKAMR